MEAEDATLARLIDQVNGAREARTPLDIRGGNTKRFYGESAVGAPINTTVLSGITSYEPTELVVTARAGTRLSELEAALGEQGQCLPFEPPHFGAEGTVGGMVAAGLSGPARASVGSVRDHVLGMTVLNGLGEVLTFGGQVAKNVAGYDVSRLMVGSLGILGLICEVSLKVLPVSVATATLRFDWDEERALEQLKDWASHPLPINASAWQAGQMHVRLSGARTAVAAACHKLGGEQVESGRAREWWAGLQDQSDEFFLLDDARSARGESLWRISVPATSAPIKFPGNQLIEWNGAQRWWRTAAEPKLIREVAARASGHATLMRGADKSAGVFSPLSDVLMRVHHRLKAAFDPARIFNPGRLYADL
jgi:glycolate oxidase FAD binding subunit